MKKKSAKKSIEKEKLYGNVVGPGGIFSKEPMELKLYYEGTKDAAWWDKDTYNDFTGPGLEIENGTRLEDNCIKFAGTQREVECFTMGVRACFRLLRSWAWCPLKKGKK